MSFDFSKAIKDAESDLKNKKLFLLLLGASGNGKSYALGTFGVKTLYLYMASESHGLTSSASQAGKNLVPVCIDRVQDSDGKEVQLTPDLAIGRLHEILDSTEGMKKMGIQAIAVDGVTELEAAIRETSKYRQMTTTENGKHNGFAEGSATLFQFREIIKKLNRAQREIGVHVAMTCILTIKAMNEEGLITDSSPHSSGYSVATGIIQQFSDVMVVGKMKKKDKIAYRFQLVAEANRTSTDQNGEIKKLFNFSPRVTGVDILSLGASIEANLAQLITIKEGKQ